MCGGNRKPSIPYFELSPRHSKDIVSTFYSNSVDKEKFAVGEMDLIRSDRSKNSLIPVKDTCINRFYQVYSRKNFKVDPKAKKA